MESYRKSHGRWPENAPWPVLSVACEPSSVQQNDSMALRTTLSPYLNADDSMEAKSLSALGFGLGLRHFAPKFFL